MELKEFLDLYDNWNGFLTINDDEVMEKVGRNIHLYSMWVTSRFVDAKRNDPIMEAKVISFGFYGEELCIRIRRGQNKMEKKVVNAIRIYWDGIRVMADLKFPYGDMETIEWTNESQREEYVINGYTLIYDEREKPKWEDFGH